MTAGTEDTEFGANAEARTERPRRPTVDAAHLHPSAGDDGATGFQPAKTRFRLIGAAVRAISQRARSFAEDIARAEL